VKNNDVERLQIDLGRLGKLVMENRMKIKPGKSRHYISKCVFLQMETVI
jgi:hypothetical protein